MSDGASFGKRGPKGRGGTAGNNGSNGNTWLTTSGAPSNGTGSNGDYAFDPATKIFYGPKAAGSWPAGVSLAGAAGTAGPAGGVWHFGSNSAGANASASQWMDTGGCTVPGLANAVRGYVALEACEIHVAGVSQTAGSSASVTFFEVFIDGVATGKGPSIIFTGTNVVVAISPPITVAAEKHVAIKPWRSSGAGTSSGTNVVVSLGTRAVS